MGTLSFVFKGHHLSTWYEVSFDPPSFKRRNFAKKNLPFAFKGHVICLWQFFLQNPFLIKEGGSKDGHLRLKDTSFAFGIYLFFCKIPS